MNRTLKNILFSVVALLPILYIGIIWANIPATVPLHFDSHMQPNSYGTKLEFLMVCLLLSGISLGSYFLIQNISLIDPKRKGKPLSKGFDKLSVGIIIFITAINFLVIIASTKNAEVLKYGMLPLIGLLFTFMGNYMYNIKPNYFAGIRTPWALNDDDNWRKTHQLGGALFFVGGIILTITSLLLPMEVIDKGLVYGILALVLIPYAYSFILFKKSGKSIEK